MMNNEKNFSYVVKVRLEDGTINNYNETNTARGYRQSWFKTPQSAKKKMQQVINYNKSYNREIIEAYCFTRSGKTF